MEQNRPGTDRQLSRVLVGTLATSQLAFLPEGFKASAVKYVEEHHTAGDISSLPAREALLVGSRCWAVLCGATCFPFLSSGSSMDKGVDTGPEPLRVHVCGVSPCVCTQVLREHLGVPGLPSGAGGEALALHWPPNVPSQTCVQVGGRVGPCPVLGPSDEWL